MFASRRLVDPFILKFSIQQSHRHAFETQEKYVKEINHNWIIVILGPVPLKDSIQILVVFKW